MAFQRLQLASSGRPCTSTQINDARLAHGGWAAVFVGEDWGGEFFFVGWQAAGSDFDHDVVTAVGQRANNVAGGLAMIWALLHSPSLPGRPRVELRSGSTYTIPDIR